MGIRLVKRENSRRDVGPIRDVMTYVQATGRRAINAMGAVAHHAMAGMPKSSDEEYARRSAICKSCEHLQRGDVCGTLMQIAKGKTCGCHVRIKARWAEQHCPLTPAKW